MVEQETARSRAPVWLRSLGLRVTIPLQLSCLKPGGVPLAANDGRFNPCRQTERRKRWWLVVWLLIALGGLATAAIVTLWGLPERRPSDAAAYQLMPLPLFDPYDAVNSERVVAEPLIREGSSQQQCGNSVSVTSCGSLGTAMPLN